MSEGSMIDRPPPRTPQTERQLAKDTNARVKRLETRFTKYMEDQGFDTKVRRPRWDNGIVYIPSTATPIRDILEVVPPGWPSDDGIEVYSEEMWVATIMLPQ